MPSRGVEALFFLLIIATGVAYLILNTGPAVPPQKINHPVIYQQSYSLSIEVKRTIKFLYYFPISVFSKIGDVSIGRPQRFLHEALSLIETVMEMEQKKAELDYRKQVLSYYLSQVHKNPNIIPGSETLEQWIERLSKWMARTLTPPGRAGEGKQSDPFDQLFKTSRPHLREKPDKAIKRLLAQNRREASRIEARLIRAAGKVRQDLRWAVLCSFCSMFLITSICICLIAGVALARRYFISDKSHLTAVEVQGADPEPYVHLKKTSPDTTIIERAKKEGWFSPALVDILSVLQAYREWPASINAGGHGKEEGGLYQHSIKVMEKMLENASPELDKRELALCGLSHDLGKIFAYEKVDGKWRKTGMYHDVLSGAILRAVNIKGFSKEAATRILLVVSHHHRPLELPVNVPKGTKEMLELLNRCDAQAAREEKEKTQ